MPLHHEGALMPISYTVRYRVPGRFWWNRLRKVTGDGIEQTFKYRFFTLESGVMVCVPLLSEVWFSAERRLAITEQLGRESGQSIQLNT